MGRGVSDLKVDILDDTDNLIAAVTLNNNGIGTFPLKPQKGMAYKMSYDYNGAKKTTNIQKAKINGVVFSIKRTGDKAIVKLFSNNNLNPIENTFNLLIHNGKDSEQIPLSLDNGKEKVFTIPLESLYTGVNIFTPVSYTHLTLPTTPYV